MGYRRAASMSRQVSETLGARSKRPGAVKRHRAREAIRFTRDVREGMDLYLSRHGNTPRPTLGQGANVGADIQQNTKREDH